MQEIAKALKEKVDIEVQKSAKSIEQFEEEARHLFPRVRIGDKVSIETKSRGIITGKLVSISKKSITVGTKFISVVDLSEEMKAKIFEDKYEAFLQSMVQKLQLKQTLELNDKAKDIVNDLLPKELLKAGYLPYPVKGQFVFVRAKEEK